MIRQACCTRLLRLAAVTMTLLIALMPLWGSGVSTAQGPEGTAEPDLPPTGTVLIGVPDGPVFSTYEDTLAAFEAGQSGDVITVVILLEEPAVLEVAPDTGMALSAPLPGESVLASQYDVLDAMAEQGVEYDVLFSTSYVLNSLVVQVARSDLAALNDLPGVARAYEDQVGTLDNATSVPFVGAPQAWQAGYTGEGVKVGIIDSGVDYTHADFGCMLPDGSPKYAGGYDFVGDAWLSGAVLAPDSDPMDQNGHGSHVAGTAVGCGVDGTGSAYEGAYDLTSPTMSALTIGPGVAPDAELYALKVGAVSDSVSEAATVAALEWAVTNGMDVVNLSLGRNFGHPDDAWTIAANNVAQAGVIVVVSAGNGGNTYYIQGSPSNADWALSVAASSDAGGPGMQVNSPASVAGIYPMSLADFAPAVYNVTANLVQVNDGTGTLDDACQTPFANAAAVAGNVALIVRGGGCGFAVKAANAQANGAVGVVIYNNVAGLTPAMTGTPTVTIPVVGVSDTTGAALIAALVTSTVNVTLANTIVSSTLADVITSLSARGPQRGSSADAIGLKPDLTAPGQDILSALLGSGSGGAVKSGTSMAAPHVAGTMALLREKYPTWSVTNLKALVMNTALHTLTDGGIDADPGRVGAGRVDANAAAVSEVVAFNSDHPEQVSVSFGVLNVTSAGSYTRTITVRNNGSAAASYTPSVVTLRNITGVSYSVSPGSITVPAGGTAQVTVTLTAAAPNTWDDPHTRPANIPATQASSANYANGRRQWMAEESGYVLLTYDGTTTGTDLRVPVYAAPRPAGTMQISATPVPTTGLTGTVNPTLAGGYVYTGNNYPSDDVGIVSMFELQYTSADDTSAARSGMYDAADLAYVGVKSNYVRQGSSLAATSIYFGIATHGEWDSLSSNNTKFYIYIDSQTGTDPNTPPDGVNDYRVENADLGTVYNTPAAPLAPEDTLYSIMWNLNSGGGSVLYPVNSLSPTSYDTRPYNTDVLMLRAWGPYLGLVTGSATFNYYVAAYHRGQMVEISPRMTYDVEREAMTFPLADTTPPLYDYPGYAARMTYNWANYTGPNPPCMLLLHYLNVPGLRPEVVCFTTNITNDLAVTKTAELAVVSEGDTFSYTLTATNKTATAVPMARVYETFPAGVTLVSSTPSQGTYDPVTGLWTIGALAAAGTAGDSATLVLTVQVDEGTAGQTIENTARIEASIGTDVTPGDNRASVAVTVRAWVGDWQAGAATTLPATGYPPPGGQNRLTLSGWWLACAALAGVALWAVSRTWRRSR